MFNEGFKETKEMTANLQADYPESFGLLQRWIYTGALPTLRWESAGTDCTWISSYAFTGLINLAEKLCLFDLAGKALSNYIDLAAKCGGLLKFEAMDAQSKSGLPDSDLCKCFVYSLGNILHRLIRDQRHRLT